MRILGSFVVVLLISLTLQNADSASDESDATSDGIPEEIMTTIAAPISTEAATTTTSFKNDTVVSNKNGTVIISSTTTTTNTSSTSTTTTTTNVTSPGVLTRRDIDNHDQFRARLGSLVTSTIYKIIEDLTKELELNAKSFKMFRNCNITEFPQDLKDDIVTCGAPSGLDISRYLLGSDIDRTLQEATRRSQAKLMECKELRRASISYLSHKTANAKVVTLPDLQRKSMRMMRKLNSACVVSANGELGLDASIIFREVLRSTEVGVKKCVENRFKIEKCANNMIAEWFKTNCPKP